MSLNLHRLLDGNILAMRLNKTLHGRTKYRKKDVPGHNCVRYYNVPGVNDALDVFCEAGTPIYAPHDGTVTRFGPHSGKLDCCYIDGKSGKSHVITCLAHLHYKPTVALGAKVKRGQLVGFVAHEVSDPHLHVEIEVDGKPITGRTPLKLAQAMAVLFGGD